MLLKRIEAPTLAEAVERTRSLCGEDVLLVETRKTSSGYTIVAAQPTEGDADAALDQQSAGLQSPAHRWTPAFRPLAERALAFGLDATVLRAVEKAITGTRITTDQPGDPALASVATRILAALIKTRDMTLPDFAVTAFVGSTGVGKTTSLAKIAARAVRDDDEAIAIVTIDTYRVAAVEQLRAFADMLSVPFEVAFTPNELRRAVERHRNSVDRVLIDTSGRSPYDKNAVQSLGAVLRSDDAAAALCVAAGARRVDAQATLAAFGQLDLRAVLMTKWDETTIPGEVLSLLIEQRRPLTHITIGQEVPDDIVGADAHLLAEQTLAEHERTEQSPR